MSLVSRVNAWNTKKDLQDLKKPSSPFQFIINLAFCVQILPAFIKLLKCLKLSFGMYPFNALFESKGMVLPISDAGPCT